MRRVAVTLLGGLLALAGVALLVLPGPGMVLCFAGLSLLATEYAWARRSVGWVEGRAREGVERTGSSRVATLGSVACGIVLVGVGVYEIVDDLPVLRTVTAVLLIAGGLFLVITSGWARYYHLHR
jgi:hypothetical protein